MTGSAENDANKPLFITTGRGYNRVVTWAVAVLDDGSEIRVRNLGDRVEVRAWDKTESCNPPTLDVTQVGAHVIDLRSVLPPARPEEER